MFNSSKPWGRIAAVVGVTFLAACGMENRQVVSAPPLPPAAAFPLLTPRSTAALTAAIERQSGPDQ